MTVKTADDPLVVSDVHAAFSAFPFALRAKFESSDPELRQIFDVGWRTARLDAHETYMDTPVLGTAPVHRRHADPGDRLHVCRRGRSARAQRDRAVRRVAHPGRHHAEPVPGRASAVHPALLAVLDRDAARPLVVRRRRHVPEALPERRARRARLVRGAAGAVGPAGQDGMVELRRLGGLVPERRAADARDRRVGDPHAAVRAGAARGGGSRSRVRQHHRGGGVSCPRRQDGRRRRGLVLGRDEGSARGHAGPVPAGASM